MADADLSRLLRTLEPVQNPGVYAFVMLPDGSPVDPGVAVAHVREPEGVSAIVTEEAAARLGLPVLFRAAWLTLAVQSDLQSVGLTAAFATALARAGIGCNVVAGVHHDHIFVSYEQSDGAMAVLRRLQQT